MYVGVKMMSLDHTDKIIMEVAKLGVSSSGKLPMSV